MHSKELVKIYNGTGINGTNLSIALDRANSKATIRNLQAPPGWSHARIEISKEATKFNFNYLTKIAPKKETTVYLNPFGYLFFRTKNTEEDFGFSKFFGTEKILNDLKEFGYKLDSTCQKNYMMARVTNYVIVTLFVTVISILIIMAIIDPPHMK
jgi:hypothetical protein